MITIYKYKIQVVDDQTISIPLGAKLLTVQVQNGIPCLWALVDTEQKHEDVFIEIVGTGNPVTGTDSREYISTFQLHGGRLVFHVFKYTGL